MNDVPVVSVVGMSGAGKTTFLEKLIRELKSRNIRAGVIKHHTHNIEIDTPGKDTWRLARAGAETVIISTPGKYALFRKLEQEEPLDNLAGLISGVDIVFTEGYKRGDRPKIEVNRSAHSDSLVSDPSSLIAIVSDVPREAGVPVFGLEDCEGVADFLIEKYKL
ncbi:MAG: molybdopterin-guanine dinucleotide biosynthesis protein B [Bacillota bacterium]